MLRVTALMFPLGQKQTLAPQKTMSLYPPKRTLVSASNATKNVLCRGCSE